MRIKTIIRNLAWIVFVKLGAFPLSAHAQDRQGLLWAVVKPGNRDTSYLLGTLHQFPVSVVRVPETVFEKLEKCRSLYLEMTLDWKMILKMLTSPSELAGAGMLDDENWNERDWEVIKNWFVQDHGMEEQTFERIKARSLDSRIINLYMALYGYGNSAVEDELRIRARANRIPVKGLDKDWGEIQSWYAHYSSNNEYWSSGSLDSLLADGFYGLADLYISYAIQDTTALQELDNDAAWRDGLTLAQWRNLQWMKQLPKLMVQRTFVAVGAAHLYGDTGVLHLLRKAGFQCIPQSTHFGGAKLERFIRRFGRKYELPD